MRRYKLNKRPRSYNTGNTYRLIPTLVEQVVPGQTLDLAGTVKIESGNFTKNLMTGALMHHYLFYVPYRLLWNEWIEFITQDDDASYTTPVTTTNWPLLFDHDMSGGRWSLNRRAFKLIYNEFFGSEEFGSNAFYSNIETDTDVTEKRLRTTEQFLGSAVMDTAFTSPTYDATTVPIDLLQFARSMAQARQLRSAQMSGDKYVDSMKRLGVDLDWRVQQAPEFLGSVIKEVWPVKSRNTSDTASANQGEAVAHYESTLEINVRGKRFAEHGILIGVAAMRPHVFNLERRTSYEGNLGTAGGDFWLKTVMDIHDTIAEEEIATATAQDLYIERLAWLHNGQHKFGQSSEWCNSYTPASQEDAVYIAGEVLPLTTILNDKAVAVSSSFHMTGQTPVPPRMKA